MNKKVEVIVDKKIYKEVDKLLKKNNRLSVAFKKTKERLKVNPELGEYISRNRWPKKIVKEYHPTNLYRYDLIRKHPGWRLIYTITPEGKVKILIVVLKILDHHRYDRLFGY